MFDINAIVNAAIAAAVEQHISTLQQAYANKMAEMAEKIDALEARVKALEAKPLEQATPEPPAAIDEAKMVEALNSQEWFWEKLTSKAKEVADAAAQEAIEDHCQTYDHDDYDRTSSAVNDLDLDDLVSHDGLQDTVRDVLSDATISVRF